MHPKRFREPWILSFCPSNGIRLSCNRQRSLFSKTFRIHISHLRQALTLLREIGVTRKLMQSLFLVKSVAYLGHTIRSARLETVIIANFAMKELWKLTNDSEPWPFSGLCDVFLRSVPKASSVAAPSTKIPARISIPNSNVVSTPKERSRTTTVTAEKPPVLALSRADRYSTMDTNECDTSLGCFLPQKERDGTMWPVQYRPKSTGEHEKKLATTRKECLSVRYVICFLYYETTRHWNSWSRRPKPQVSIPFETQSFKIYFNIVHRAREKHQAAEAPACLKADRGKRKAPEDEVPVLTIYDQAHARNDNCKDRDDADASDVQWGATQRALFYVPVFLASTKTGKEQPPTFQQLLGAQHLDPEWRQILKVVGRPRSNFTASTNAPLVRVKP